MKKIILSVLLLAGLLYPSFAQKDNKSGKTKPKETEDILKSLSIDSTVLLSQSGRSACHCIDSVLQSRKTGDADPKENIKTCIDKEVDVYQLSVKLMNSLKSSDKNITLNVSKESDEYKRYYSDIEEWLMDSCSALKLLIGSNDDEESEYAQSKNPDAIDQYNLGLKPFRNEDYAAALPYFAKAVSIDPKFVFALDNLAICYRRTNRLDDALTYYKKSLEVYPKGKTPLQNIPVIYELKKDYDKALISYDNFLKYYPDDAEGFYGQGRILIIYKEDMEKGLDKMCKAFLIYKKEGSPYRVDAEKNIAYVYSVMKKAGKEDAFNKILADNNISIK